VYYGGHFRKLVMAECFDALYKSFSGGLTTLKTLFEE
jgi:hypothetical protein